MRIKKKKTRINQYKMEKRKMRMRSHFIYATQGRSKFEFNRKIQNQNLKPNKPMPKSQRDEQYDNEREPKKPHTSISLKKKEKLIQLVEVSNLTIYRAAKRLKICHPTAKFIIKNHRKVKQAPEEQPRVKVEEPEESRGDEALSGEMRQGNAAPPTLAGPENVPAEGQDNQILMSQLITTGANALWVCVYSPIYPPCLFFRP